MKLQRGIQHDMRITKLLTAFSSLRAQAPEDNTEDSLSLCLQDESVSPRIINQRRWAQATVDSAHQGRSECSEARTSLLHVILRVRPAL